MSPLFPLAQGGTPSARRDGVLGRLGRRSAALVVFAALGLVSASAPAAAQSCLGGVDSDFDGDGLADLAIGDPDATVAGAARSGSVHIAFGSGVTQTITQNDIADNDNAAGDRFGHTLAVVDWNSDGCSDLLIGTPFEDWAHNSETDAGVVVYIPGSPSGLTTSAADIWAQGALGVGAGPESGDQYGYSITAGAMRGGTGFFVAGAPGEAIGAIEDAGMVIYATPGNAVGISQNSTDVPGTAEVGDLYGYALDSSASGFVVGDPGEAVSGAEDAGDFDVFEHNGAATIPTAWGGGSNQGSDEVSGSAEPGDMLGYAVAMADFIPSSGTTSTLVAVSSPTEDVPNGPDDSGWVFEFDGDGSVTQKATFDQDTTGVTGVREDGDLFGAALTMINRDPAGVTAWDDLLLMVGIPGEDTGAPTPMADRGGMRGFSMIGEPGDHDFSADAQLDGANIDWRSQMQLGTSLHATAQYLFIADPFADVPSVYGVPWDNLVADGDQDVLVYTPADFGLTAADTGSFGASLA